MARIPQLAVVLALVAAAGAFTVPPSARPAERDRPLLLSSDDGASSSLKRLPESAVELTLRIPPAASKAAYDKVLGEVCKKVSIPGFRKGARIPPAVIENAWAERGGRTALRGMAINELCSELVGPALKDEHGLEPIGQPKLAVPAEELAEGFVPGEEATVAVRCDVWPEIAWAEAKEGKDKPYEGLKGSYKRKPFDEERFDAALRDLRERYAETEPYEDASRSLEMGDACQVDMAGYLAAPDGGKGDPLPAAASGDNVEVVLGPGRYMEGLVEGLVGAKVGDTRTVNVRFPDALRNKDLAGKDAVFDVTVLSASRRVLPEADDDFAAKVRPGLTAEGLRDELRKAVDSQDAEGCAEARNAALASALSEVIEVDVPDTLVTGQAKDKYTLMMTDMRTNGMADDEIKKLISPENFEKYKEISKPDIVKDFKVSMAVDEIARLEGIKVPDYQVDEQLKQLRDQAAKEGQDLGDQDDEQMRRKVESTLERRMVYDFLADCAELEVEYVDETFDEEMMAKLAEESLAREQEEAAAAGGDAGGES